MKVLAIRFCAVSEQAKSLSQFFSNIGLTEKNLGNCPSDSNEFSGAIFPAGDSWIEIWQQAEQMPAGTMLQVVVDNADEFATHAKSNGIEPQGPFDQHGEHIYFFQAPGGLPVSIQSKL